MQLPIDLLAFGPHPDDVEIGVGGSLAKQAAAGSRIAIVDLTQGEMGSNGTPAQRIDEGERAAAILGAAWRRNLGLPDRGLDARDAEQLRRVIDLLRLVRPTVAAINWGEDRHPDHVAAAQLLEEAIFTSGLRRYESDQPPFRPVKVLYYFINDEAEPSFYVDITPVYQQKTESLFAHASQFGQQRDGSVQTRLNDPLGLPYRVLNRDRFFGAKAGVAYAEGFVIRRPRLVNDLVTEA
jgi:bacillithiol biosynthesis deacetylase BshB1